MLYVTTREKHDAFTAARTLAVDNNLYAPYQMPRIELEELDNQSFGQTVATMLNRLFGTHLTAWDIEFSIGRYPVKVSSMGQKITVAECWRNLDGSYEMLQRRLAEKVTGKLNPAVSSWLAIASRIAVLTGVCCELRKQGNGDSFDIAVPEGDFVLPMAAWYGREMGLPIASIIVGCRDGSPVWNLLHGGTYKAGCPELERLVFGTLGFDMNARMGEKLSRGEVCGVDAPTRQVIRKGIFTAVVSKERTLAAIPNVYNTTSYILEPKAAMAYSALMDYRARSGESRQALIFADNSPADYTKDLAVALKITAEELKEKLK